MLDLVLDNDSEEEKKSDGIEEMTLKMQAMSVRDKTPADLRGAASSSEASWELIHHQQASHNSSA